MVKIINFMTKIGLALGSGGARGYAHIGAIKALEEAGWNPDLITGSSIGALIGVLYCYYGDIEKVEEIMLDSYWQEAIKMLRPSLKSGVMSAEKVQKFLEEFIGQIDLEDLPLPLGVLVTDFQTSERVLIRRGSASKAVQASMAFPFFIEPLKVKNRVFWDGGLSSQVPTGAARQMGAERVIGVNLNSTPEKTLPFEELNSYEVAVKAIKALQYHMTRVSMREADINISPRLDPTVLLGFGTLVKKNEGRKIIERGYREAKKVIAKNGEHD